MIGKSQEVRGMRDRFRGEDSEDKDSEEGKKPHSLKIMRKGRITLVKTTVLGLGKSWLLS